MARITSRDLLSLDEGRRSLQRARFHFDTLARALALRKEEETNIAALQGLVVQTDAVITAVTPLSESLRAQERESRRAERMPSRRSA